MPIPSRRLSLPTFVLAALACIAPGANAAPIDIELRPGQFDAKHGVRGGVETIFGPSVFTYHDGRCVLPAGVAVRSLTDGCHAVVRVPPTLWLVGRGRVEWTSQFGESGMQYQRTRQEGDDYPSDTERRADSGTHVGEFWDGDNHPSSPLYQVVATAPRDDVSDVDRFMSLDRIALQVADMDDPRLATMSTPWDADDGWVADCIRATYDWYDPGSRVASVTTNGATTTFDTSTFAMNEDRVHVQTTGEACSAPGTSGQLTLTTSAIDMGGNTTKASPFTVGVDADDPTLDRLTADGVPITDGMTVTADKPVRIAWEVADAGSGTGSVQVSAGDQWSGLESGALTVTPPADAPLNVFLHANDQVGHSIVRSHQIAVAAAPAEPTTDPTPPGPSASGSVVIELVPTVVPVVPMPTTPAGSASASDIVDGGGPAGVPAGHRADRTPPKLTVRVMNGRPGQLRRSNILVLRVRATERSLWRLRIAQIGFTRSAIAAGTGWRTVRINLGDANPVGRRINAARAGGVERLRIRAHGWDRARNTAPATWHAVHVRV